MSDQSQAPQHQPGPNGPHPPQQPHAPQPDGSMPPNGPPTPPGSPGAFPSQRGPKSRGPLLIAVGAAVVVIAIVVTVLAVTGVFGGDDDNDAPTATSDEQAETTDPGQETEQEAPEPDPEPTEDIFNEGGFSEDAEANAICEAIAPVVAEYTPINYEMTEAYTLGTMTTCFMVGGSTDPLEAPYIGIWRDIDAANPDHGLQEFGYQEGVRSGCEIEEGVLPQYDASAYFHGDASTGCIVLGQTYALHVADGDTIWSAEIQFGEEGASLGGEKEILTALFEAAVEVP